MPSISNKWIDKLDMLPTRDYITLTKAILRGEPEPQITPKYQGIASDIFKDIERLKRDNEYQKKHRSKSDSQTNVRRMSDECQTNVRQEEKREAPPPCSPSSSPPHPLNITPYNPPPEEKREESYTPGAGACVKSGGIETAREIIAYLNKVCGTRYRANVPDTLKHINARLSEGFTVDDFKRVIDRKYVDWKGTDYEKFMRPLTLFSTKFEGYLNAPEKPKPRGNAELSDEEKREILDIWGG